AVAGERRLPPMHPETASLPVRRHAIAEAGEDEAPVRGNERIQCQGGDDTVHDVGRFTEDVPISGTTSDRWRAVTAVQAREINEGNAGDHTLQIAFERSHQSSDVAAEGDPEEADPIGPVVNAKPPNHTAEIPRRLGQAVNAVHEVD